jgi:hypothetical protein
LAISSRHLHLTGCELVDIADHLLLTAGEQVDALPYRIEVE